MFLELILCYQLRIFHIKSGFVIDQWPNKSSIFLYSAVLIVLTEIHPSLIVSYLALPCLKIQATLACTFIQIVNGAAINSIFFIFFIDSCY